VRVPNGGWHFSYMGGGKKQSTADRVKYKIKSAAHQEYNNRHILWNVRKNIKNMQDIFGRDSKLQLVEIDETYPKYLRDHLDEYKYLLYPKKKGLFR
jgi:beta-1,4-mannosyl-glycoprotein beta-1,4-N-acetylglucosaminyltransferase